MPKKGETPGSLGVGGLVVPSVDIVGPEGHQAGDGADDDQGSQAEHRILSGRDPDEEPHSDNSEAGDTRRAEDHPEGLMTLLLVLHVECDDAPSDRDDDHGNGNVHLDSYFLGWGSTRTLKTVFNNKDYSTNALKSQVTIEKR